MNSSTVQSLKSFAEFYPYYLGKHANRTCRLEKNRPASFKRPLYSFMGDGVMYKDNWVGKIPF